MNQQSDEQIVRDALPDARVEDHTHCCGEYEPFRVAGVDYSLPWRNTAEEAWAMARKWLESRQQEIAEIREEIERIEANISLCECFDEGPQQAIIYQRILTTRLLPELERLQKGLKTS